MHLIIFTCILRNINVKLLLCWEWICCVRRTLSTNMICTSVLVIITGLVLQVAQLETQMQWSATITGVVTDSLAESKPLRFFKDI